jgi:aminoglycoside phosphotransferase family enzyme
MSWVFLVGDRVYKLKKPVRFSYLDFSTLARREAACRAELRLSPSFCKARSARLKPSW